MGNHRFHCRPFWITNNGPDGNFREGVLIALKHPINLIQVINLYCSAIPRTIVLFVYTHYTNHSKTSQNLQFAAILDLKKFTNITNKFHNYENTISDTEMRYHALGRTPHV